MDCFFRGQRPRCHRAGGRRLRRRQIVFRVNAVPRGLLFTVTAGTNYANEIATSGRGRSGLLNLKTFLNRALIVRFFIIIISIPPPPPEISVCSQRRYVYRMFFSPDPRYSFFFPKSVLLFLYDVVCVNLPTIRFCEYACDNLSFAVQRNHNDDNIIIFIVITSAESHHFDNLNNIDDDDRPLFRQYHHV